MEILKVENLSYKYSDSYILNDISFSVYQGDFLGIIGPNGAGKTTLFNCMLGFLSDYSGNIIFFGQNIRKIKHIKEVGYIQQKKSIPSNFPITVKELISLPMTKIPNKNETIDSILKQTRLDKYKNTQIGQLSGGEQQRLRISIALATKPKILILDEPTNELDHESQHIFYSLLSEINERDNITIIWSSHDLDAVNKFANKVACINRKMFFHGNSDDFFDDPDNLKNYSEYSMQKHMHFHNSHF
ncbi:MAG: metal ABC transporter ATP-binding protein [Nitrososphaeraceae archaeon]